MEIEKGGFYRTRDGRKLGPAKSGFSRGRFEFDGDFDMMHERDGTYCGSERGLDIVSEWTEGPVRTVTRREVVPGSYGRLKTLKVAPSGVSYTKAIVSLEERFYSRDDLTEIISLLAEVRDGLELAGALE